MSVLALGVVPACATVTFALRQLSRSLRSRTFFASSAHAMTFHAPSRVAAGSVACATATKDPRALSFGVVTPARRMSPLPALRSAER